MGPDHPSVDASTAATSPAGEICVACERPKRAGCGTCARREHDRRRALALARVRGGSSARRAAREAGIARNTLALALREPNAKVPNQRLREAIERAVSREPTLSYSEIARRADPPFASGGNVSRLLGRVKERAKTVGGRQYPAHFVSEISVENAVRLLRAAGLDPVDFDDL